MQPFHLAFFYFAKLSAIGHFPVVSAVTSPNEEAPKKRNVCNKGNVETSYRQNPCAVHTSVRFLTNC